MVTDNWLSILTGVVLGGGFVIIRLSYLIGLLETRTEFLDKRLEVLERDLATQAIERAFGLNVFDDKVN